MSTVPSWLMGHTGHSARRVQRPPKAEYEPLTTFVGYEIDEPRAWDFDGDLTRRAEVYDHNFNPPRLVRRCGYLKCLRCREPFWSPHCTGIRLCNVCKGAQAEPVSKPGPQRKPGPKDKSNFGEINFERRS